MTLIELRTFSDYLVAYTMPLYVGLFLADIMYDSLFAAIMTLQAVNFYLMAKQHMLRDHIESLEKFRGDFE